MAEINNNPSSESPEIKEPSTKLQKLHENGNQNSQISPPFIKIEKLTDKAVIPSRGSPLSAGYDLSSAVDTKVPARGKALVATDSSIAVPPGTYARVGKRNMTDIRNRGWMYKRKFANGAFNIEFLFGVEAFLEFEISRSMSQNKIRCPCVKCECRRYRVPDEVRQHVTKKGFMKDYYDWRFNCEVDRGVGSSSSSAAVDE